MKRMTSLCLAIGLVALTGCKSVDLAMLSPNTKDQNAMVSPLIEKRETITATGYAVYGQQLDSSTTVADMVVTNDTFRTKVEGVIYGARLVSITPVGDDTYETTLSLDKDVVQDLRILFMGQMVSKGR